LVVTGSASGFEYATARRCAEEGATGVVTHVDEESGEEVAAEFDETTGSAMFRKLDVTPTTRP
jgi:NAD(P)-dependent dehydrogenase (short-subunit alcohol dehydrogenase family)